MKNINGLFNFVEKSKTPYHAVEEIKSRLLSSGFTELSEGDAWEMKEGDGYFVIRGGSSIIAFRYSGAPRGFNITATHSDSPTFRVKSSAAAGAYTRLEVEAYGGAINYTWLDRPLGIAGRAVIKREFGVESALVDLKTRVVIPSVAPHLDPSVNSGFAPNLARDLMPLYAIGAASLTDEVAAALGTARENIISHDLYLYNPECGCVLGAASELIVAPRIDDLASVYASLQGFLSADSAENTPVLAVFHNEEVGSSTKQGANSTFLEDTLTRVAGDDEKYRRAVATSFMISADNAHARHPNHPELSDREDAPILGGGVVVKYNANQRYTTDCISDAVLRTVAERADVRLQSYSNRPDIRGGSTLGSIATTRVSLSAVDIGLPQLAMHSVSETAAVSDVFGMIKLLREFYSTNISFVGKKVRF